MMIEDSGLSLQPKVIRRFLFISLRFRKMEFAQYLGKSSFSKLKPIKTERNERKIFRVLNVRLLCVLPLSVDRHLIVAKKVLAFSGELFRCSFWWDWGCMVTVSFPAVPLRYLQLPWSHQRLRELHRFIAVMAALNVLR